MPRDFSTRTDNPLFFGIFLPVLMKCTKDVLVAQGNEIDREERDSRRYSITRAISRRFMADNLYAIGLKETRAILSEVGSSGLGQENPRDSLRETKRILGDRLGEREGMRVLDSARSTLKKLRGLEEGNQRASIRNRCRIFQVFMELPAESILRVRVDVAVEELIRTPQETKSAELVRLIESLEDSRLKKSLQNGFKQRGRSSYDIIGTRIFVASVRERATQTETAEKAIDFFRQGCKFLSRGRFSRAISCYKKSFEHQRDIPFALHNMGTAYTGLDDYFMAIDCYKQAVAVDANFQKAWTALGSCYSLLEWAPNPGVAESWRMKHRRDGLKACGEALRIDPRETAPHVIMGKCYADLGEKEKALESYGRAVRLDPNFATGWLGIAAIDYSEGDFIGAIRNCRKALKSDPAMVGAWNLLGAARLSRGQIGSAIRNLKNALRQNPRLPYLWQNLGEAYKRLDDKRNASICDDRAKLLQSGNA